MPAMEHPAQSPPVVPGERTTSELVTLVAAVTTYPRREPTLAGRSTLERAVAGLHDPAREN